MIPIHQSLFSPHPGAAQARRAQRQALPDRIASYNPQAANKLLDKISDKFETLASFPRMGKSRNELIRG